MGVSFVEDDAEESSSGAGEDKVSSSEAGEDGEGVEDGVEVKT